MFGREVVPVGEAGRDPHVKREITEVVAVAGGDPRRGPEESAVGEADDDKGGQQSKDDDGDPGPRSASGDYPGGSRAENECDHGGENRGAQDGCGRKAESPSEHEPRAREYRKPKRRAEGQDVAQARGLIEAAGEQRSGRADPEKKEERH